MSKSKKSKESEVEHAEELAKTEENLPEYELRARALEKDCEKVEGNDRTDVNQRAYLKRKAQYIRRSGKKAEIRAKKEALLAEMEQDVNG